MLQNLLIHYQQSLKNAHSFCLNGISSLTHKNAGLIGLEINVPFQHKTGYMWDKVMGGDLVPPD